MNAKIRKIGSRGKITIYIVNGQIVREEVDEEFTNFGQHFRFSFIPKYEFWLDQEMSPDERRFFIDHLLVEWKLMNRGKNYKYAIETADKIEASERQRSKAYLQTSSEDYSKQVKKIHKHLLGQTAKKLQVWIVDGELVRDLFLIDFTEGGHHFVYHFVPRDEVWLDNDLTSKERPFVLLHELNQRKIINQNKNY